MGATSPASTEDLRLNYSLLAQRRLNLQNAVFGFISMSLAAEAALWVGLLNLDLNVPALVLFGLGIEMIGVIAPLSVRFYEVSNMLDRQLLDEYEAQLDIPPHLRMHTGLRFQDRLELVLPRLPEDAQRRVTRRRVSKDSDDHKAWQRADAFLDMIGAPTIVWTAVLSVVGIAGVTTAFALAFESVWVCVLVAAVSVTVHLTPLLASAQAGPIGSLRRRTHARST